jgi:hypothetical protein
VSLTVSAIMAFTSLAYCSSAFSEVVYLFAFGMIILLCSQPISTSTQCQFFLFLFLLCLFTDSTLVVDQILGSWLEGSSLLPIFE